MRPKAQFSVYQCAQFSSDPNQTHNQAVKSILKYLNVTTMQGLILKPYQDKGI